MSRDGVRRACLRLGSSYVSFCVHVLVYVSPLYLSLASEQILSKARAIESNVYLEFRDINAAYRNKMRRLYLNLKDKHNPRLRESVVSGDLQVARFCNMTVQVW